MHPRRPAGGRAHRLACRPGRTEQGDPEPRRSVRGGTSAAWVSPPQRRTEPGTLHAYRPITAANAAAQKGRSARNRAKSLVKLGDQRPVGASSPASW